MNGVSVVDIGERLRLARERAGLTQAQVAGEIGIARTTLVAIERGKRQVRVEELRRLARSYGESVNALARPESVPIALLLRLTAAIDLPEKGGSTNQEAREVLDDLIPEDIVRVGAKQPGTLRLNLLAAEAHRQGLMSEGQLARLLRLDRVELREILDSVDAEESDRSPQLSR